MRLFFHTARGLLPWSFIFEPLCKYSDWHIALSMIYHQPLPLCKFWVSVYSRSYCILLSFCWRSMESFRQVLCSPSNSLLAWVYNHLWLLQLMSLKFLVLFFIITLVELIRVGASTITPSLVSPWLQEIGDHRPLLFFKDSFYLVISISSYDANIHLSLSSIDVRAVFILQTIVLASFWCKTWVICSSCPVISSSTIRNSTSRSLFGFGGKVRF